MVLGSLVDDEFLWQVEDLKHLFADIGGGEEVSEVGIDQPLGFQKTRQTPRKRGEQSVIKPHNCS